MARAKTNGAPAAAPAPIEDDVQYDVVLAKPQRVGHIVLRPGAPVTMKGKVLKELPHGVAIHYTAIADGGDQ